MTITEERNEDILNGKGITISKGIITLSKVTTIGGTSAASRARLSSYPRYPKSILGGCHGSKKTGGSGTDDSQNTPSSNRKRQTKRNKEVVLLLLPTRRTL